MPNRARLSILLLFVLSASVLAQPPQGHLLVVGGNGTTDDILRKAVATAGGAAGRVAIFPQASELPETGKEAVEMWTKAGIGSAVVLDPADVDAALEGIAAASFIWFPGGDQNKLAKALAGTPIPEAIRARYRAGALVGGTSAGAAVLSRMMITGEADLKAITAGRTELAPGLALWPEVIVDQHFLKRQRNNRLISAVLDHPSLVGVGVDETTAVFVTGPEFEVLGRNSVLVIDARRAQVDKAAAGDLATGRGLVMSVLKAGMTYTLDDGAR
ncbi:MAG: cphB 1 [Acidobacteria bacterium]|nr:cphB 1 [Acidobacteriota bacterium]